jgi:hypothetical protein
MTPEDEYFRKKQMMDYWTYYNRPLTPEERLFACLDALADPGADMTSPQYEAWRLLWDLKNAA